MRIKIQKGASFAHSRSEEEPDEEKIYKKIFVGKVL